MQFGEEGRFDDARREFIHSYAQSGSPVALFNLASTLRSLELPRDAAEAFIRLLANPDLDASVRERATPMYADVVARVTRLRLYGPLEGATIRIDDALPRSLTGQTQTIVVNPGPHDLIADRRGSRPWRWSGAARAGASVDLLVEFQAIGEDPTDEAGEAGDEGWVIAGVSAAIAVALGVIIGAAVLDAEAQLGPRTGLVVELP